MSEKGDASLPPRLVRSIGALQSKTFDLAIIGGGITGAGVARHAAAAGLSVALVEAEDFASGTSSKSTKLIHGGLRYLAMGDLKLVKEAALERKSVHDMAPHLAEPVTMVMPLRNGWQWWKFKIGLSLYEWLGAVAPGDRHRSWSSQQLKAREPSIEADAFPYTWAYREYLTDDARLVLGALRAAAGQGAECSSYVRVELIERRRDQFFLHSRDQITGNEFPIRCRCVVNATGPWAERVLAGEAAVQNLDTSAADMVGGARLHLSKGVHIAVPHDRLPINNMIFMETSDKRVIFAIPRGQVTYLGTTDTSYALGPDRWPSVSDEDIHYLLAPLASYFTGKPIEPADVVSTWAGLRPLINQSGKTASKMSRKDEIWIDERGVITIAGGKLTGFRLMAEEVMEQVGRALGRSVEMSDPLAALPGGDFSVTNLSVDNGSAPTALGAEIARIGARYQIADAIAGRLVRLYGTEVENVLGVAPQPICGCVFVEEVDWAVSTEGALSLEDVLYRRLRCVWFEPRELVVLLPVVADRMAKLLEWDSAEHLRQRVQVEERIAFDLAAVPLSV